MCSSRILRIIYHKWLKAYTVNTKIIYDSISPIIKTVRQEFELRESNCLTAIFLSTFNLGKATSGMTFQLVSSVLHFFCNGWNDILDADLTTVLMLVALVEVPAVGSTTLVELLLAVNFQFANLAVKSSPSRDIGA